MHPVIIKTLNKIIANQGREFKMKTGDWLTYAYEVDTYSIIIFRDGVLMQDIHIGDFEIALEHIFLERNSIDKVTDLPKEIKLSSSYIWAILMDDEIRGDYW